MTFPVVSPSAEISITLPVIVELDVISIILPEVTALAVISITSAVVLAAFMSTAIWSTSLLLSCKSGTPNAPADALLVISKVAAGVSSESPILILFVAASTKNMYASLTLSTLKSRSSDRSFTTKEPSLPSPTDCKM